MTKTKPSPLESSFSTDVHSEKNDPSDALRQEAYAPSSSARPDRSESVAAKTANMRERDSDQQEPEQHRSIASAPVAVSAEKPVAVAVAHAPEATTSPQRASAAVSYAKDTLADAANPKPLAPTSEQAPNPPIQNDKAETLQAASKAEVMQQSNHPIQAISNSTEVQQQKPTTPPPPPDATAAQQHPRADVATTRSTNQLASNQTESIQSHSDNPQHTNRTSTEPKSIAPEQPVPAPRSGGTIANIHSAQPTPDQSRPTDVAKVASEPVRDSAPNLMNLVPSDTVLQARVEAFHIKEWSEIREIKPHEENKTDAARLDRLQPFDVRLPEIHLTESALRAYRSEPLGERIDDTLIPSRSDHKAATPLSTNDTDDKPKSPIKDSIATTNGEDRLPTPRQPNGSKNVKTDYVIVEATGKHVGAKIPPLKETPEARSQRINSLIDDLVRRTRSDSKSTRSDGKGTTPDGKPAHSERRSESTALAGLRNAETCREVIAIIRGTQQNRAPHRSIDVRNALTELVQSLGDENVSDVVKILRTTKPGDMPDWSPFENSATKEVKLLVRLCLHIVEERNALGVNQQSSKWTSIKDAVQRFVERQPRTKQIERTQSPARIEKPSRCLSCSKVIPFEKSVCEACLVDKAEKLKDGGKKGNAKPVFVLPPKDRNGSRV